MTTRTLHTSLNLYMLSVLVLAAFAVSGTAHADSLNRQLEIGDTGADVSVLQTFLAKDPTMYPQGLITGYFGSLTKIAVTNFQARNNIATVGRVGPATLAAINAKMLGNFGVDVYAPKIAGVTQTPATNSASVQWNTNELAAGIVYYGTTWPSMTDSVSEATISGSVATMDTALHLNQKVTLTGLQSNTVYYYVIYARDGSGNVQITWPSTFRTTI